MNPNTKYQVVDGRIKTRSLEIHIVDHCNLRCWGCCSLSPISEKSLVAPEVISQSLALAKQALSPSRLKLVGGEPLLHPKIVDCLIAARNSDITSSVSVTTNGFLLPKVDEKFWALIDHMTVSLYPKPVLSEKTISLIKDMAEQYDVEINWKTQNTFVGMDRKTADVSGDETQEIYSHCWLRRRCHLIAHGRFYTCTRPSHFHAVSGLKDSPYLHDGVPLDSGESLYNYLNSKVPLSSCALCLGGDAVEETHRQLSLQEVKAEHTLRSTLYQNHARTLSK